MRYEWTQIWPDPRNDAHFHITHNPSTWLPFLRVMRRKRENGCGSVYITIIAPRQMVVVLLSTACIRAS